MGSHSRCVKLDVDVSVLAINLNRTLIFEWYVVRCGIQEWILKGHLITFLSSTINIMLFGGRCCSYITIIEHKSLHFDFELECSFGFQKF